MPDTLIRYPFPAELDAIDRGWAADCVPLDPPPFTPGQRVIFRSSPEFGAMTITSVRRYDDNSGEWEVLYEGDDGSAGRCPVWRVMALPPGWTGPPAKPFGSPPAGSATEAWERKRDIDAADPEYQRAMTEWAAEMVLWQEKSRGWL